MQTLAKRLSAYLATNGGELPPFGRHLEVISFSIIEKIKELGKYESVKKTKEIIFVNGYPQALVGIVDEVISEYYANRNVFMRKQSKLKEAPKRVRYFNYGIEDWKTPAFELALKEVGIPVLQNFNQKGIAQYKIPSDNPILLIKLGKRFQKERYYQRNRERRDERQKMLGTSSS